MNEPASLRKGSDAFLSLPVIVFELILLSLMEAIAVAMTFDHEASVVARVLSPTCFLVGLWAAIALRRRKSRRDEEQLAPANAKGFPWSLALLGGGVGTVLGKAFVNDHVSLSVMLPPIQLLWGLCITMFALLLRERVAERRALPVEHEEVGELADLLGESRELARQVVAAEVFTDTYARAHELMSLAAWWAGQAAEADLVASPLFLIWGSLVDRVDGASDDAVVTEQAAATMKRAAREWLALGENDEDGRLAYLDRWVSDECAYERPSSTR